MSIAGSAPKEKKKRNKKPYQSAFRESLRLYFMEKLCRWQFIADGKSIWNFYEFSFHICWQRAIYLNMKRSLKTIWIDKLHQFSPFYYRIKIQRNRFHRKTRYPKQFRKCLAISFDCRRHLLCICIRAIMSHVNCYRPLRSIHLNFQFSIRTNCDTLFVAVIRISHDSYTLFVCRDEFVHSATTGIQCADARTRRSFN